MRTPRTESPSTLRLRRISSPTPAGAAPECCCKAAPALAVPTRADDKSHPRLFSWSVLFQLARISRETRVLVKAKVHELRGKALDYGAGNLRPLDLFEIEVD